MVVATPTSTHLPHDKTQPLELPIIDLSSNNKSELSKLIVKACEEFGFFKVINHGVHENVITTIEHEAFSFFGKSLSEKQRAGPANPYGYGSKTIGFKGDSGEVEYLLLHTNPHSISQKVQTISSDNPEIFRSAVKGYIEAVRKLACEILELMAEGLKLADTSVFSRLITSHDSDSLLRVNYYPPLLPHPNDSTDHLCKNDDQTNRRIGFGEHSDPQILTILRSNDVAGLQIFLKYGVWVPVTPDPSAFCINVGDVLQAMTNGRFVSVRHRALANSYKSRMSMAYFGAPPLTEYITCLPELIAPLKSSLYRPFTWAEYKEVMYSLQLGDHRLNLFRVQETIIPEPVANCERKD